MAAVVAPVTYRAHYQRQVDVLNGNYAPLYARHAIANAIGEDVLLEQALRSSLSIPKVYLALVESNTGGRYEIHAVHRPTTYDMFQL